jgi:ADP-ribose pyrophosphatase YjhB (NUDIX family)
MSDSDVPSVEVAVALILDADQRLLWTWNQAWGAFAWPMSKRRHGESIRQAAERAGAEAFGVPVQAGVGRQPLADLHVSERDHTLKFYRYHVRRVEPHNRYAAAEPIGPHIWLTAAEALSGDFRPLSPSCLELAGQLLVDGLLPGRSQLTSTLVLSRGPEDDPCFLLRWNESWGYALPTKRRTSGEDILAVARRVATEELGLAPSADLHLAPARPATLTLHDDSASTDVPTFYVHSLFRAELPDRAELRSPAALVWASVADVVKGSTDASQSDPGGGPARPGPVSPTVRRILEALGTF